MTQALARNSWALTHNNMQSRDITLCAALEQDPVEARSNVGKRLEFINGELDRLDSRLKALEKQAAERQQKVLHHLH